jgi:hypothetical protein
MKIDLQNLLIDEGPFHIGWYKKYKISDGVVLAIHTFQYPKVRKESLLWV